MIQSRRRRAAPRQITSRDAEQGDFTATVRDLTATGLGVVPHPCGRVLFAAGVWPGERGRFRVRKLRGRSGEATLLELLEASPDRLRAPCPHHGHGSDDCGGCPWMFMSYEAQLQAKQRRIEAALGSLIPPETLCAPWPAPAPFGYRNRARLRSDGVRLGFLAAASNRLVDVDRCLVLNETCGVLLEGLRAQLPRKQWRPDRRGHLTTIAIDDGEPSPASPGQEPLFRQGNTAQNGRMRRWLADSMPDPRPGATLELFCGSGNFTEVLAAAGCAPLLAVDGAGEALTRLDARGLPAVTTRGLNLRLDSAIDALGAAASAAEMLVLDPPRQGFPPLGRLLTRCSRLRELRYISCDPATLARDLASAVDQGYRIVEIQPVDLFPQTPHVELLVNLARCR